MTDERVVGQKDNCGIRTEKAKAGVWAACTPGGTYLAETESDTQTGAWKKLLKAAAHMPYNGVEEFKQRGYTVDYWQKTK